VALAGIDGIDFCAIDIEADDTEARGPGRERERHSNISETDDADGGPLVAVKRFQVRQGAGHSAAWLGNGGHPFSTRASMSYLNQICQWFQAPSRSLAWGADTAPAF